MQPPSPLWASSRSPSPRAFSPASPASPVPLRAPPPWSVPAECLTHGRLCVAAIMVGTIVLALTSASMTLPWLTFTSQWASGVTRTWVLSGCYTIAPDAATVALAPSSAAAKATVMCDDTTARSLVGGALAVQVLALLVPLALAAQAGASSYTGAPADTKWAPFAHRIATALILTSAALTAAAIIVKDATLSAWMAWSVHDSGWACLCASTVLACAQALVLGLLGWREVYRGPPIVPLSAEDAARAAAEGSLATRARAFLSRLGVVSSEGSQLPLPTQMGSTSPHRVRDSSALAKALVGGGSSPGNTSAGSGGGGAFGTAEGEFQGGDGVEGAPSPLPSFASVGGSARAPALSGSSVGSAGGSVQSGGSGGRKQLLPAIIPPSSVTGAGGLVGGMANPMLSGARGSSNAIDSVRTPASAAGVRSQALDAYRAQQARR